MVGLSALDASKVGDVGMLRGLGTLNEKLTDKHGASCVHYAARGGSVAVLEFLIKERRFSIFNRSRTGASALHDAAARGNTAVVKWILTNTDLTVDDQDGAGITGLHLAARYGHILTVEWMIDEAESDVTVRTAGGALPLHFAVVGAVLNCIKILVEENPSHINMQMNNGTTAVYLACQGGHLEVLKYLVGRNGATKIKAYDGMSCLHAAAQMGHLHIVQWLIKEEKMNPNDRDFDGLTPLHYAASRGHARVLHWLMTEGNARIALDNIGGSPLHNAAEHNENECIQALLDTGCDVSLTDNDGLTAAELADNCQHLVSASLIRGLIPPLTNSFDTSLEQKEDSSPSLVFPPPPAYPPGDESLSPRGLYYSSANHTQPNNYNHHPINNRSRIAPPTTTTATTNTSFLYEEEGNTSFNNINNESIERFPSPPLPPPPPPLSPPLSSPPTEGSPISPPSPISGDSWLVEDPSGTRFNFDNGRYNPDDSVDTAHVVHIVQAEVHKANNSYQGIPAAQSFHPTWKTQRDQTFLTNSNNYPPTISNNDFNKSVISSSSFPPPPPPLPQDIFSTDKRSSTNFGDTPLRLKSQAQFPPSSTNNIPRQSREATSSTSGAASSISTGHSSNTNTNSSKISQFKALFENKMSTSNGNSSPKISAFPTQPLRTKQESAPQGASVINISGKRATIVTAHTNAVSNGADTTPSPSSPQPLQINRNSAEITVNGQTQPKSPISPSPSSPSVSVNGTVPRSHIPTSPVKHNHSAAKHDLISDIQSAISGTSSLSLRSARSRGDGVSMVYRSSKEIKENGNSAEKNTQIQNNALTGEFDPKNFLDQVEKVDSSGHVIPEWRRHVLAKHVAEKALKDFEEKRKVDQYESRFKDMPAWKRALIEKREGIAREDK